MSNRHLLKGKITRSAGKEDEPNPQSYELSATDRNYLEGVALGKGPVRDYARSLLGLLTGQRFELWIPEGETPPLQQPNVVERYTDEWDWRVYPNPAGETLQLAWRVVPSEEQWHVSVTDLAGRMLRTERIAPSVGFYALDLSALQNGFYILSVTDRQHTVQHRAKFVIRR